MKRNYLPALLTLSLLTATASGAPLLTSQDMQGGAPSGILRAASGELFVTDTFNNIIWKVDADGSLSKHAGQIAIPDLSQEPLERYTDGTLDSAFFMEPWDIAPFMDGYAISDSHANVLRYMTDKGIYTLAGTETSGSQNGVGTAARFSHPTGLAADPDGLLYIADTENGSIRTLDQQGRVRTLCSGLNEPTGLCWHEDTLYIAETGAHRILTWNEGRLSTLIGSEEGFTVGPRVQAKLSAPQDVAVAEDGSVYISDTGNSRICKLADDYLTTLLLLDETDLAPVAPRNLLCESDILYVTDPFSSVVLSVPFHAEVFSDVSQNAWYYKGIQGAFERGLISGTGANQFKPELSMSRAMFVQVLSNLQTALDGSSVIQGESVFKDISEGSWYADSVNWASAQGIAVGNDGFFLPEKTITRQELAVFMMNYAKVNGKLTNGTAELDRYHDGAAVAPWAQDAMAWAVSIGIYNGNGKGDLLPAAAASRAEAAQIVIRFMDWLQSN